MTQVEFITKVKIDHEFYRLTLVDYTGYQFTYKGKFKEMPNYINEIINSDITISASKVVLKDGSNEFMSRHQFVKSRISLSEMNKLLS